MFAYYILSVYEQMGMLLLLMTIDKEECQTGNTQKDDNYHKISQAKAKDNFQGQGLGSQGQGLGFWP